MSLHEIVTPDVSNYVEKRQRMENPLAIPRIEDMSPIFRETADHLAEVTGTWNPVELYTPVNVHEEEETFFTAFVDGNLYNPHFVYEYADQFQLGNSKQELDELLSTVRQYKPRNQIERLARIALYYKIQDDVATTLLVEGLQTRNETFIAQALQQKYPGVDDAIWQTAQQDFARRIQPQTEIQDPQAALLTQQEITDLQHRKFNPEEIQQAFTWALDQYGILKTDQQDGFAVVIDEHTTSIDVRDKSVNGPTVFIPRDRSVNGIELLQLIGHEVEGHARQSINGQRLFLIGGERLKVDNEMLYEGLGKRYDDALSRKLTGQPTGVPLPYFTYGIRAAEQGHSFYEIFQEQLTMRVQVALHESDPRNLPLITNIDGRILMKAMDSAWLTTYRVMRGHIDTSNKYKDESNEQGFAMAKDLAYIRGYLIDKELQKQNIGFLNESAVIASGGLQLLAELAISENDLPLPYKDVATQYWEKFLKTAM